jgi:ribosomal protein L11 methyltransferase
MSSRRWQHLSVTVPQEAAEAVANFLTELGSLGVVEGVRDFSQEGSQPDTAEVQGFFPPETSPLKPLTHYLRQLVPIFPALHNATPHLSETAEEEWQETWRSHFPPVAVGSRLLILPPWEPPAADEQRVTIVINPGMAFGTGHHPSTRGSLEALEGLCASKNIPAQALDLGTGSGILAIALAKLGVAEVWAVDIEAEVLPVAQQNLTLNQVCNVRLSQTPLPELPQSFPLIVANILATTLIALEPALATKVEKNGPVILSGIQEEEAEEVLRAFCPPKWQLQARFPCQGWTTLVCLRL